MKALMDSILTPLITTERKEVILDCVASLEEIEYSPALDELNMVCMLSDDNTDTYTFLGRIDDILRSAHDAILTSHEITISDEADQTQRQAIVKTLLSIESYILPDQICLLLQGNFDNEEILAQLIPMFENITFEEILPFVTEVSDSFINTLSVFINNKLMTRGLAIDFSTPVSRIRLINKLIDVVTPQRCSLMLELSNAGMRVGKNIDFLMENSFAALDNKNAVEAIYEIVALVFFSSTTTNSIWSTVNTLLNDYTENHFERNLMHTELNLIKKQMSEYLTIEGSD